MLLTKTVRPIKYVSCAHLIFILIVEEVYAYYIMGPQLNNYSAILSDMSKKYILRWMIMK